ncbi:MAG: DUF1736 domain-containing protein, partial [Bacteroidia bacterium]|nr:DUF1736 domain-containing protein [Bacteroidia bacterium]
MEKQSYGKIYLWYVIIAFLLYGNTIKNDYALDDEFVVSGKDNIVQKGIKSIPKILTSYHAKDESGNEYEYRPMVKISYALEIQFFGSNVHLHHFFNVIYYAICLIVLFKVLLLLFENYSLETIVWMVIFFAFIPVHSEVVASLKNRDVMLSFIFSMLMLIFFLKWIRNQKWFEFVLVPVFFLLALLSKFDALPLIAILPIIYVQEKKLRFNREKTRAYLKQVFFIIFALIVAYIFLKKGQKLLLNPATKQRVFNYFENPLYFENKFIYRVFTMVNSMGFYLMMLLFPIKMSCYYGFDVISVKTIDAYGIIGIAFMIILAYLFFKEFQKKSLIWYGVMFFGISVSMFLNFVKPAPGIVADRFLFMPSLGWVMILIYCIEWMNQKYFEKKNSFQFTQINWWKRSGGVKWLVVLYFIGQSMLIWYRNYEWRYKLYLYEADVKKYPQSVKLHILYASQIILEYLQNTGRLKQQDMQVYLTQAMEHFRRGIEIDSSCGSCYNNIAFLYMNWLKDYENSIPILLKAYQLDSTRKELLCNIAIAYFKTNRNEDTVELFVRKSIKRDKDKSYEIPHSVMLEYCKKKKMYDKGIEFFKQELVNRPRSEYLHFALAELL